MRPLQLSLDVRAFNAIAFESTIREAALGAVNDAASPQIRYLASYLSNPEAGAKTIVVEHPYVDRHYIEEFSRYYATSFRAPPPYTTRLHLFDAALDRTQLDSYFLAAAEGNIDEVSKALQASYLGFIVVRPLPSAPIGRTVLRPYREVRSRVYAAAHDHRVHLAGIELTVHGVPFQQQEIAVGACATTAVWVALSAASRATGQRAPTPFQVTEAATRFVLTDRPIPAEAGLNLAQLLDGIRASNFAPLPIWPRGHVGAFTMAVKCYLSSGIPVVLLLQEANHSFHAVTAVGYRNPDNEHDAPSISLVEGAQEIRSQGLSRIYVHEDRLGPYARMRWLSSESNDGPLLQYEPEPGPRGVYSEEPMTIYAAIAPLYPKLRLSAHSLLTVVGDVYPLLKLLVGRDKRDDLCVDISFALSGKYVRAVLNAGLTPPQRAATFAMTASLPRYVGIIRFASDDGLVCDVVCDTTDIVRTVPRYGSVLAFVTYAPGYSEVIRQYTKSLMPNVLVV